MLGHGGVWLESGGMTELRLRLLQFPVLESSPPFRDVEFCVLIPFVCGGELPAFFYLSGRLLLFAASHQRQSELVMRLTTHRFQAGRLPKLGNGVVDLGVVQKCFAQRQMRSRKIRGDGNDLSQLLDLLRSTMAGAVAVSFSKIELCLDKSWIQGDRLFQLTDG